MLAQVTLKVIRGKLLGKEFQFAERTTCLMGRADDCHPRLPNDVEHSTISRHHCLLDINPPDIRIRDFGSLNGTFVSGKKIGQRDKDQSAEAAALIPFPEFDLKDGDEIELGDTVFRVGVHVSMQCAKCGAEIPDHDQAAAQAGRAAPECAACRAKEAPLATQVKGVPVAPANQRICAQCGKNVSAEMGELRQGEFICADCKADPLRIAQRLLEQAQSGEDGLASLKGFTVVEELGRGGMGAVYLARHAETGEQVALKLMLPRIASDTRSQQMFLREVEATRALRHPHVVRLRDAGAAHGTFFFTLEYCDGGSVATLRDQHGGKLPANEAIEIVLQALEGLEYAHNVFGPGNGLVHRDLKPSNLFLSGSGANRVIKVGDYGLGKAFDMAGLSGQTRTGALAGTPVFMPRQQVINFKYAKPEVDVWAMAATLYHLLTGQFPRDFPRGRDPWQIVLQTDPVPIRQRDPSIPEDLAQVIDTVLRDKPDLSVKSAAEFKDALLKAVPDVSLNRVPVQISPAPESLGSEDRGFSPSGEQAYSPSGVVLRYPAPIAIPYQRCFQQNDPRIRLDLLFAAVEAMLRYLVTLGVSDLLSCLAARSEASAQLPAHPVFDFLRRPKFMQLGMWCEAVRETARALAGEENRVILEFPDVCRPGGRLDAVLLGDIISRRNECVHRDGGIAMSPEECRAALRDVRPKLEDALQEIRFVTRYPLAFVRRGLGPAQRHVLCSGMGIDVGLTMPDAIEGTTPFQEGIPFVVTPDGSRLLYVWPLLTQRMSPLTGRPTLYVFEDIPDKKRPFLTEIRAAAIDVHEDWLQTLREQPSTSHEWLLERLRSLPSPQAIPKELQLAQRLSPHWDSHLIGQTLGTNRLIARVGAGGMGTVYKAETPAGDVVAVKVLEVLPWSEQVTRFLHEFERMKRMGQCPGIIHCHDVGVAVVKGHEYPWYSMEFAARGNLRARLNERIALSSGQIPWDQQPLRDQIIKEFEAILTVVEYLHQLDIIHRDIKPDNVLILESGDLRLSDFGLVKNLQPSEVSLVEGPRTATGAVLGTWGYMAPEQQRGQEAEKPTDVYAIAILLAELATGQRPEPNPDQKQGSTLLAWSRLAKLPKPLRRLIEQCTDVDPHQRPADATALRAKFAQVLDQLAESAG